MTTPSPPPTTSMPRPPAPPNGQTTTFTFTSPIVPWESPPPQDHRLTLTIDPSAQEWKISLSASLPQNIPPDSPEVQTLVAQSLADQVAAGVQYTLHIQRRFWTRGGIQEWVHRMVGLNVLVNEVARGEFGAGLEVRWRIRGEFRQQWEWTEVSRRDRILAPLGMREPEEAAWVADWSFGGLEEVWIRGEGMWWAE
ncbi:hypothetical protein MFRU_004g04240 [Monilinia fructicola]|nr:hypothetical protein MFRU_004g04240 [Monilinia fructicola]